MGERHFGIGTSAQRARFQRRAPVASLLRLKPAKIVEPNLRGHAARQLSLRVRIKIAQQTIAQSVARQTPELLLDLF